MARTGYDLQFKSFSDFPATGSNNILYVATDSNTLYRWNGSAYVMIGKTGGNYTTSADPASSVAVTTAIIDAFDGVVITLTGAGNAQTLASPTVTTAGKKFTVVNNDTSTNSIDITDGTKTTTLEAGTGQLYMRDGSAWISVQVFEASDITYTPYGNIAATNVQTAINELEDEKLGQPSNIFTIGADNCDYTTIQAALTAQSSGGELFIVYPGTYTNDTITFTANNQCVVGAGTTAQQTVTQADANILDFGVFTGCRVDNIKMQLIAATSAIFTITGSTGDLRMRDCFVGCTNLSVTAASQPGCIAVTGAGLVTMKRGDIDYNNAVSGASAIKSALSVGTGGEINIDTTMIDVDGAGASTAIAVVISTGTGVAHIISSEIYVDDADTSIGTGYYFSGSGSSQFYRNNIHVTVGAGASYGAYITGTANFRSFYNHIHAIDVGGTSYSFFTGVNATIISQFDDLISDNGITGTGDFIQVSSDLNGGLTIKRDADPNLILGNITKEDIEGGRESSVIFKGKQSGGEETTLARIIAQHDGTSDDQKGDIIFQTNDGTDGDAPTERLRIDSDGLHTITGTLNVTNGCIIDADGIDLVTGNDYQINNTSVLNATTLGSAVVNSSLTSVGTLGDLTVTNAISSVGLTNAAAITIASTGAGVNITTHTDATDDFTVNTSMLVVEGDTGNVGIGTNIPGTINGVTGYNGLHLSTNGGAYATIDGATSAVLTFNDRDASVNKKSIQLIHNSDYLSLRSLTDAGAISTTNIMVWETTGNVGIGASPLSKLHIESATASEPIFTIKSTHNGATSGGISFIKDRGAAPDDNNQLGIITFTGDDAGQVQTLYSQISSIISDTSDTQESGQINMSVAVNGTMRNLISIGGEDTAGGDPAEVVINEDSIDCDFRVESDNLTNALFVDGSNGIVSTAGGRIRNTTTVNTTTYDLLITDDILNVTYTSTGAVTSLTLPTAQTTDGRVIVIKDAGGNAGTNNITIDTEGAETIDGAATKIIVGDYDSITLYSDGSNWYVI